MGFFDSLIKGVKAAKEVTADVAQISDLINPKAAAVLPPRVVFGPPQAAKPMGIALPVAVGAVLYLLTK